MSEDKSNAASRYKVIGEVLDYKFAFEESEADAKEITTTIELPDEPVRLGGDCPFVQIARIAGEPLVIRGVARFRQNPEERRPHTFILHLTKTYPREGLFLLGQYTFASRGWHVAIDLNNVTIEQPA